MITPSSSVTTPATTPPPTAAQGTDITSDYDTFLVMLTTQLENQDPLDPVDSSDFAMQLATFSGVEQQVLTNDLLEGLSSQFDVLGISQLAGWVGQEARSAAPVWMDGDPVALAYTAASSADRAVLVVKDAAGNVVAREDVPTTGDTYQWLGADATGNPLPEGAYSLSLESYAGEEMIGTSAVESYALIEEAQNGPDGISLILEGGIAVAASAITALRAG